MSELKPCPHCGSTYTQARYMGLPVDRGFEQGWRGECCTCGALTRACNTEAEAIAEWNMRYVETCVCDGTIQWQWTGPTTCFEHELSCGHVITSTEKEPPKFCEECGRRVEL